MANARLGTPVNMVVKPAAPWPLFLSSGAVANITAPAVIARTPLAIPNACTFDDTGSFPRASFSINRYGALIARPASGTSARRPSNDVDEWRRGNDDEPAGPVDVVG